MTSIVNADAVATVALLATLVNRVVAMLVSPLFERLGWDKAYVLYVAIVIGVLAAFGFGSNAFATTINPTVGTIVTGIILGGGASLVHDLTDRPASNAPTPAP